jgi:hypothetical protein
MPAGNLVTLIEAEEYLAPVLPEDQTALQLCIDAASQAIQKWAKRDYVQTDYVEVLNSRGFSAIQTRQYPINSITRLATTPTPVLQITNTSTSATRATAALATTGDASTGLTATGITLNVWINGAQTTNTIAFSANETLTTLAAAIGAAGNGWTATALLPYQNWPAADFIPVIGAQSCVNNSSANFQIHTQDVTDYSVMWETGQIRFNNQTLDPIFALMNLNASPVLNVFPPGWQSIRVEYNAGYATTPGPIAQACLITVKSLMQELQLATNYRSETVDKWRYELAGMDERAIPDSARKLIAAFGRSYRGF